MFYFTCNRGLRLCRYLCKRDIFTADYEDYFDLELLDYAYEWDYHKN